MVSNQVFELAIKYFRAPQQFPELSDVGRPLPENIGNFLEGAANESNTVSGELPEIWNSASSQERRAATIFFVKHALLAQGGDYYRCLGLNHGAASEEIRRHFHALISLLSIGSLDDKSNWDENTAIRINEAYSVLRQPDKRHAYDSNQLPITSSPVPAPDPSPETHAVSPSEEQEAPAKTALGGGSFMAQHLLRNTARRDEPTASVEGRHELPRDNASKSVPDTVRPADSASEKNVAEPAVTSVKPFQQFLDSHFDRAESAPTEEELRRLEYSQLGRQDYSSAPAADQGAASEEIILPDLKDHSALIISETAGTGPSKIGPLLIVIISLAVLIAIVMYTKYSVAPGLSDRDDNRPAVQEGAQGPLPGESFDSLTGAGFGEEEGETTTDSAALATDVSQASTGLDSAAGSAAETDAAVAGDAVTPPESAPSSGADKRFGVANEPKPVTERSGEDRQSAVSPPLTQATAPVKPATATASLPTTKKSGPQAQGVVSDPSSVPTRTTAVPAVAKPKSPEVAPESPAVDVVAMPERNAQAVVVTPDVTAQPEQGSADVSDSAARAVAASGKPATISQTEVDRLLDSFVTAYRAGDINKFLSLFASDVQTNGRSDLSGIRGDYQKFFEETDAREFVLKNMNWNFSEVTASGQGRFSVGIRYKGDVDRKTVSGTINFVIEARSGSPVLTQMFHSYD